MAKTIISLCDYSGIWSQPYVDAKYNVIRVDLGYDDGIKLVKENLTHIGMDVCNYEINCEPWGVLAAPPCTTFCRPAARWWKKQDREGLTREHIKIWRSCLKICKTAKSWWALENPPGRHKKLMPEIGDYSWQFQPWEYGDPWVKQTYIWGTAKKPNPNRIVTPISGRRTPKGRYHGKISNMSSSWKRQRAETPKKFAEEFIKVNP